MFLVQMEKKHDLAVRANGFTFSTIVISRENSTYHCCTRIKEFSSATAVSCNNVIGTRDTLVFCPVRILQMPPGTWHGTHVNTTAEQ